MSAPSQRRPRLALTAPGSSSSSHEDAREVVLAAHLKRLVDRQRHALSRMSGGFVPVTYRTWFDGQRLSFKSRECWWFREPSGSTPRLMREAKLIGRGPLVGSTPRWCYVYAQVSLADVVKIDWQDVTTASLATVFETWNNGSALQQSPGLGECMDECAPRRKARREELDRITLHVWNLRKLIEDHVACYCGDRSGAWQLEYQSSGFAVVPPLRIAPRDLFPVTEHEAAVLQRRPHFANLLHHGLMQQIDAEQKMDTSPQ